MVAALALAGSSRIVAVDLAPATGSFGSISFTNPTGWSMFIAALDFPPPVLSISLTNDTLTLA